MQRMSDLILGPAGPTAPRATAEFRIEDAVREQGHAYVRYRDGRDYNAVALDPAASPIYIGRDAGCGVRIVNDARVSRRHARLIFGAGQWSIEDGPSRNGTYVEGERTSGEQILDDATTFTVGKTLLSLHVPLEFERRYDACRRAGDAAAASQPDTAQGARRARTPVLRTRRQRSHCSENSEIAGRLGYQAATIRDAISDLYRQAGLPRGRGPASRARAPGDA